ncbi:ANK1, partial [Symbiodinium necroappetens]
ARHGAGFWKADMFECTDSEFMARLESWGREFALSMVGRVWPAAIYGQHRLQVAYIQEYFKARANATEAELGRLRQLSEKGPDPEDAQDQVLQDLRQFFDCILQDPQVKIVDLAGGPGCCAAGAWRFFTGSMGCCAVEATVADPVEEWSWCHELLGLQFRPCASLSDMLVEDCTFTADVVLLGWAMNFASASFFDRLRMAFNQRSTFLPGSRSQALVIVMDRRLDHLTFKDKREKELRKPGVLQKDYGANVCYSWVLGSPPPPASCRLKKRASAGPLATRVCSGYSRQSRLLSWTCEAFSVMLCIRKASGEEVIARPLDNFVETCLQQADLECPTIRALKRYLQTLCGLPRFRQRLILSDGTLLDDNDALVTAEAQLVLLAFCQTTEVEEAGLKYAAGKGETEMMENLLQRPQDPDLGYPRPLWLACGFGHLEAARLLLEAEADTNAADTGGATPLSLASQSGHSEVVRLLLLARATSSANNNNVTPLLYACQDGHTEVVSLLLEARVDTNQATNVGHTPLFMACQNGYTEVVRLLLAASADAGKASNKQVTPLLIASQSGHLEVARLLLEARVEPGKTDQNDVTPLLLASQDGHVEMAELLLSARADVGKADIDGETPLLLACLDGHLGIAGLLLEARADVDKARDDGATPLMLACQNGHLEVVQRLLESRVDPGKSGRNGVTPMWFADQTGNSELIRLLQEASSDSRVRSAKRARLGITEPR